MAKNYKAYEAAEIIAQGINKDNAVEYQDIVRRFPFFAAMAMRLNPTGLDLLRMLPEYITARKINKGCKEALGIVEGSTEDDLDEVPEEKEEVEEKPKKKIEKKAEKKTEKKPKKKIERKKKVVEDDDDDVLEEEPVSADEDEDLDDDEDFDFE